MPPRPICLSNRKSPSKLGSADWRPRGLVEPNGCCTGGTGGRWSGALEEERGFWEGGALEEDAALGAEALGSWLPRATGRTPDEFEGPRDARRASRKGAASRSTLSLSAKNC